MALSGLGKLLNSASTTWEMSPIVTLRTSVITLIVAYFLRNLIYNLFLSPLAHFPGPKHWAISAIPSQLSVLRGHTHLDITALHNRYGPVIRIGPNELAFNSPQAWRDIYGTRGGKGCFSKDRMHYIVPLNGVDSINTSIDDAAHSRQRRLLAYAFSEKSLREQEVLIRGYVDILIGKLREATNVSDGGDGKRRGRVDLNSWMNYTTFDITGDLMFGESFDGLKLGEMNPWIKLIFNTIKSFAFIGAANKFPLLSSLLHILIPKSLIIKGREHFEKSSRKVDRRLEIRDTERPDFMSAFLKNGLSEQEGQYVEDEKIMSRAELHSNASLLIVAGSETSASLLSGCVFHLCKHPLIMKRVVEEIRSSFTTDEHITISETAKLPYLAAVIEESLRIYPPFVTHNARVVPPGGATVAGDWIPERTLVACHHYATYHSSSNFTLPDSFIPERWLGTDARFVNDKKDAFNPFSLGPRNCIGKQLAYAEIRQILCKLFFNFDVELLPECSNWLDQEVYFIWDKPPLMVRLTDKRG